MFNDYSEIPANYRRIILVETGHKRIKNVHLDLCNEIIEEHLQYEKEIEELMNFELKFRKPGGELVTEVYKTPKEAFARLDFEMDYDINTPITAMVRQAGRIVRAIKGGRVYQGQPRGKIEVKPMPKDRYDTYTLFNGGARCD